MLSGTLTGKFETEYLGKNGNPVVIYTVIESATAEDVALLLSYAAELIVENSCLLGSKLKICTSVPTKYFRDGIFRIIGSFAAVDSINAEEALASDALRARQPS